MEEMEEMEVDSGLFTMSKLLCPSQDTPSRVGQDRRRRVAAFDFGSVVAAKAAALSQSRKRSNQAPPQPRAR